MIKYILCLLILFIYQVTSYSNPFCFTACQRKMCDQKDYNRCSGCTTGFMKDVTDTTSGGSKFACITSVVNNFSSVAKYQPIGITSDITNDLKGNLTIQTMSISAGFSASGCRRDSTYDYSYFGNLTTADIVTISHSGVADPVYFYKVRIRYGILTIGQWDSSSVVKTQFVMNASEAITSDKIDGWSMDDSRQICGSNSGSSDKERYRVITQEFWYNDTTSMDFVISVAGNSRSNPWGIMNVIVQLRLCHPWCEACFNDAVTACTACDYSNYVTMLSGTTCALTCASGYGQDTMNPSVCIRCDVNCLSCLDLSTNCTICYPGYLLFVNGTGMGCSNNCPGHFYPNTTAGVCDVCNISCLNCTILPDKCISCNAGVYLYNNFCYNPCPILTYGDSSLMRCFNCDQMCLACSVSPTTCSACVINGTYRSFLLNTSCVYDCGIGYYEDDNGGYGPNLCMQCNPQCITCNVNSSYCSGCIPGYYLINNLCEGSCPFPQYFSDNTTWTCMDCSVACVNLTMKLYFKNNLKETLICDLTFTQALNWNATDIQNFIIISLNDPLVTLASFDIVYQPVTSKIMRISLTPKGYIFIYNVTFSFKTISFPGIYNFAANHYRFSDSTYGVSDSIVWFLIKAPSLSETQKSIIDGVSEFSEKILSFTTLPYFQQIKKAGIFALLLGGAQVTSTSCLVNTIPAQNFYEGVRFWASFVFFDVPPWQQDSKRTKYVVVPNQNQLVKNSRLLGQHIHQNRTLFDVDSISWRFQRTGHSSFFIFDSYINIFLIVLCWVLMFIGFKCIKSTTTTYRSYNRLIFSFTHKVHEISIFYISLTTLLEWIYFDAASFQRWLSFGLCIGFNVYFLFYELYIYYDMINYPAAEIGNDQYQYYCLKYGFFLKNVRFVQYDKKEAWSMKHWFRPYNFHILSYYKKFLMMISLPIFYETKNAQIFVLMGLQLFEILRFLIVWPFQSKLRNFIRLGLQLSLLIFFVTIIIQSYMVQQIMLSDPNTLEQAVNIFYLVGWVGFAMVFTFNLGHIIVFIYDLLRGCKKSNRQLMDQTRKFYYMQRLNTYEEQNEDVPLALVNKWVKLGNLNNRKYDQLPQINLRVQYFRILKTNNGYQIDMRKLFQIFMTIQFNYNKQNNITAGKKLNKRFTLNQSLSPKFFNLIDGLYKEHIQLMDFEYLTIKTFQKINQADFKPGDKIQMKTEEMLQKIQLETYAGQKKVFKLDKLLPGFPLPYEDLKQFI